MIEGFVFLDEVLDDVRWDAKYATWDNFTGKPVTGYEINRVVGTKELAAALLQAKKIAARLGYGLLLWDGYRPQCAVDSFLVWAKQPEDGYTKKKHYPKIARNELISKGYVAAHSSHSRGSAIDLTLFELHTGKLLPMGSDFDYMDTRSHWNSYDITEEEMENRKTLCAIMESCGFKRYEYEWWHYVLKNEPYPDTYFDFSLTNSLKEMV